MQSEQVGVIADHENAVSQDRHAAIDPAGGVAGQLLGAWAAVMPDLASAAGVERVSFVHAGDVHYSVGNHRGDLEGARRASDVEDPLRRELLDVARVDLGERAEAVAAFIAVIGGPG